MSAGLMPMDFASASAASVRIASAREAAAATCCCNWAATFWLCHQMRPPPAIASTTTAASAASQVCRLLRRSSDSMRRMVDLPTGLPSVEGVVAPDPVVAGTRSWVSGTALRSAVAASALAAATTRVAAASIAAMVRVRAGAELDDIVGQELDLAADALAVEHGAVAGIEVGDAEVKLVVVFDADHRVAAADGIVALHVKGDGGFRIAAEGDFLQAGEIELVDLVDFGSAEMADHNSCSGFCHGISPKKTPARPSKATLLEMQRFS